jgi:hypothetical protein
MAETWLRIANPFGLDLVEVGDFLSLDYTRALNDIGVLQVSLRPDFDMGFLPLDGRIQVWRQVSGYLAYLDTETVWFIRKIRRATTEGGDELTVTAYSATELLKRRIVAYNAQTAQSAKTDFADDMMKEIVYQNLGAGAIAARDISAYLSIQADLGAGPTLTKAFSRRVLLPVLQELSDASADTGPRILFDIVAPTPDALEFRTYATRRGNDHSLSGASPLILSTATGSLSSVEIEEDYSEEATYVYGRGDGALDAAVVEEAEDAARVGASPLNRREVLTDAGNTINPTAVANAALDGLEAGRPRRTFRADIVDTPASLYGVHWAWGDEVSAEYGGVTYDCVVDRVHVSVTDAGESVEARLERGA